MLNWLLYSLAWKMYLNFSILQLWRAYQSRCNQVWTWFRKLKLRSTKWYMDHVDCMNQSGNKACLSWPIIAKFFSFEQLYWLNQVITIQISQNFVLNKTQAHCVGKTCDIYFFLTWEIMGKNSCQCNIFSNIKYQRISEQRGWEWCSAIFRQVKATTLKEKLN